MTTASMESEDGSGSSKHDPTLPAIILGGDNRQVLLILDDHPDREARKSTSTSSVSSEEDFFQLDAAELQKPAPGTVGSGGDNLIFPQVVNDLHLVPLVEVETINLDVPPVAPGDVVPDSVALLDARRSPPVQEMVRSDVPEPFRIPSSVFARTKSTAPLDWSVASNESLFSIHMGNSSFSGDHEILLGKSGELSSYSPVLIVEHGKGHEPTSLSPEELNAEAMKDVLRAAADEHAEKEKPPSSENIPHHASASASRHSNGSTTSINSFAFPILTGEVKSGSVRVSPEKKNQPVKPEASVENRNPEVTTNPANLHWCLCFPCSFCR